MMGEAPCVLSLSDVCRYSWKFFPEFPEIVSESTSLIIRRKAWHLISLSEIRYRCEGWKSTDKWKSGSRSSTTFSYCIQPKIILPVRGRPTLTQLSIHVFQGNCIRQFEIQPQAQHSGTNERKLDAIISMFRVPARPDLQSPLQMRPWGKDFMKQVNALSLLVCICSSGRPLACPGTRALMQVARGKEQLTLQTSHPSAHFIGPLDGWDFGDSNRGMARGEWWRCVKKKKIGIVGTCDIPS